MLVKLLIYLLLFRLCVGLFDFDLLLGSLLMLVLTFGLDWLFIVLFWSSYFDLGCFWWVSFVVIVFVVNNFFLYCLFEFAVGIVYVCGCRLFVLVASWWFVFGVILIMVWFCLGFGDLFTCCGYFCTVYGFTCVDFVRVVVVVYFRLV